MIAGLRRNLLLVSLAVVAGCSSDERVEFQSTTSVAETTVALPGSSTCSVRLLATDAHPFQAEFDRRVVVDCGRPVSLALERDPGGLGRIELLRDDRVGLVIVDAFQVSTLRDGAADFESAVQAGKFDRYSTACTRSRVFGRAPGEFLGAFDYCDHRWQFLPAAG
jgi:hypothetical protein